MSKEMVISANPHETRVAIMEEGLLCEYYVEREKEFALVGSIYKGRVTRVLPGMQSSFVDIGLDSDAFLYVSDFLEGIEELDDHIADEKSVKTPEASQAPPAAPAAEYSAAAASLPEPSASPLEPLPGESISRAASGVPVESADFERGKCTGVARDIDTFVVFERAPFARSGALRSKPPGRARFRRWTWWPRTLQPRRTRRRKPRRRPPLRPRIAAIEICLASSIR